MIDAHVHLEKGDYSVAFKAYSEFTCDKFNVFICGYFNNKI